MLLQPGQISHGLGRVINVALQVDQRRTLGQHPLLEPFIQCGAHFAHIGVTGTEEHVVTDADCIGAERDHIGRFTDGFAMGDLGFALIQILLGQTEQVQRRGVREAGSGGVIAENRDTEPAVKQFGADIFGAQGLEGFGQFQYQLQLLRGLLPGQQKIFFMQVGFECSDLFD